MTRGLAVAMLLGIMTIPAQSTAQGFGGDPPGTFRLSWNAITTGRGRPAIEGYIVNDTGLVYRRVQLAIDIRDANDRRLATALVNLNDHLRPHDRLYFRARLPTAGARYDVRVQSSEVLLGGGM